MSVIAESGITRRTKRCNVAEVKRGTVGRAIGRRPRRVGNVTSDMGLIAHELEASLALAVYASVYAS